jgi:O-antigen ligase
MKVEKLLILSVFSLVAFSFISISFTASFHILLALAIMVAFFTKEKISFFPQSNSQKMLWLFVLFAILSVLVNPMENKIQNIIKLKYFVFVLLAAPLYFKYKSQVFTPKLIRCYLNILFISTSIATISGIIAMWTGFHYLRNKPSCHLDRVCGMYGMYMSYAYGIQFVVVLLAGIAIHFKKCKEYINLYIVIPSLIINFLGLYFAYTRGALIGLIVSIPFFFIRKNTRKFILISAGMIFISATAVLTIPKLYDTFFNRPGSNDQRSSFFQAALIAFKESPIFGLGYKNFESQSVRIKSEYKLNHGGNSGHAHNNFLEALASTGVVGFVFFSLFIVFWFYESWNLSIGLGDISLGIVVAFFVSGMVQYTFGDGENLFVIMFLYLLSQIFGKQSQKKI